MADQSQVYRPTDRPIGAGLSAMELLDPVALEARLVEARARRAEAIARRQAVKDGKISGDAEPAQFRRPEPAGPSSSVRSPSASPLRPVEAAPPTRPVEARTILDPGQLDDLQPAPAHPERERAPEAFVPPPWPLAAPPLAAPPLVADGRLPARRPRGLRDYPLLLAAMFVTGLIGGGTIALVAPGFLRDRLAQTVAPVIPVQPSVDVASPAPVIADEDLAAPEALALREFPEAPALPMPGSIASPSAPSPEPPAALSAETAALAPETAVPAPPTIGAPPVGTIGDVRPAEQSAGPGVEPADPDPRVWSAPVALAAPDAAGEAQAAALRAPLVSAPPPVALAAPPVAEASTAAADARVLVHYPPSATEAGAAAVQSLQAAGVMQASAVQAGVSVSLTNIRYYHPEDRAAAFAISGILAPGAGDAAPEARDFTDFRPQPAAGVIEVWISGRAPTTAPRAVQPAASTRSIAAAPADGQDAAEIQRLLQQRAVERMLREQLRRN